MGNGIALGNNADMIDIGDLSVCNCNELCERKIGNDRLSYKLISSVEVFESRPVKVYGIEVECTLFGDVQKSRVTDITSDYEFALQLLDIMADNAVLPATLKDIIQDFVDNKYTV